MCKKANLYQLIYCCEWLEEHIRLWNGKIRNPKFAIDIKEDKIFFECLSCREERSEATFEDKIKEE